MPPLDGRTAALAFACSLVPGDALLTPEPDPTPFAARFAAQPTGSVVSFRNIGGDATLVVQPPIAPAAAYGHAAAFFRTAPAHQRDELLRAVGALATASLASGSPAERPVWISTAGLGVPWLHVRLDARPKYYRTRAYRDAAWLPADPSRT